MKAKLLLLILFPIFGFSQLWDFTSSNGNWTKKGSGQFTVATSGTTAGNLHLSITGTTTTNNFLTLENLVQSINTPVVNYKFLRVKLTNNSVVNTITFRADATNPTGANKSVAITPNSTSNLEYLIDLTGIVWGTGAAGTYELRLSKAGTDTWGTSQSIAIDELEFMGDVIKNDHLFDALDNWLGETNASNGTNISLAAGKLTVTPTGALNAKIKNDYYSIDGANKFIHILYKNNSTNNNSIRVNYYSPSDNYLTQKALLNQAITTNATDSELIIDASAITEWTGNIRKISFVLTNYNGTIEVPTSVDTGTLEIDRIVINNSNSPLKASSFETIKDVKIYPNPTTNFVNISSEKNYDNALIFDMNGKKVASMKIENNTLNLTNLNSGIYNVVISNNETQGTIRIVKK